MASAALVLAAGRGERLGGELPKGFVSLEGVPLLVRSLAALAAAPELECLVPVIPPGWRSSFDDLADALRDVPNLAPPVEGGAERQDSVQAGLEALAPEFDLVAVHDAARPLVRPQDVSRVLAAARRSGAALLATPLRDTVKRVRDGVVWETPPRAELWAAQTPQVFRREILREALAKASAEGFVGTDDAQLVERLGVSVSIVEGDPDNLKVTRPADLALAEALLRARAEGGSPA